MVEVPMITNYAPMTVSIRYVYLARWWFQIFFIFTPILGKMKPFWLIFFQMGLVQPPTSDMSTLAFLWILTGELQVLQLHGRFVDLEARQGLQTGSAVYPQNRGASYESFQDLVTWIWFVKEFSIPTKTQLSNFLGTPGEDYFKGNPKSLNFYFLVIWWGKGSLTLFFRGGHFFQSPTVIVLFWPYFVSGV